MGVAQQLVSAPIIVGSVIGPMASASGGGRQITLHTKRALSALIGMSERSNAA